MMDQESEQSSFSRVAHYVASGARTPKGFILSPKSCSTPRDASVVADVSPCVVKAPMSYETACMSISAGGVSPAADALSHAFPVHSRSRAN